MYSFVLGKIVCCIAQLDRIVLIARDIIHYQLTAITIFESSDSA